MAFPAIRSLELHDTCSHTDYPLHTDMPLRGGDADALMTLQARDRNVGCSVPSVVLQL